MGKMNFSVYFCEFKIYEKDGPNWYLQKKKAASQKWFTFLYHCTSRRVIGFMTWIKYMHLWIIFLTLAFLAKGCINFNFCNNLVFDIVFACIFMVYGVGQDFDLYCKFASDFKGCGFYLLFGTSIISVIVLDTKSGSVKQNRIYFHSGTMKIFRFF